MGKKWVVIDIATGMFMGRKDTVGEAEELADWLNYQTPEVGMREQPSPPKKEAA